MSHKTQPNNICGCSKKHTLCLSSSTTAIICNRGSRFTITSKGEFSLKLKLNLLTLCYMVKWEGGRPKNGTQITCLLPERVILFLRLWTSTRTDERHCYSCQPWPRNVDGGVQLAECWPIFYVLMASLEFCLLLFYTCISVLFLFCLNKTFKNKQAFMSRA